MNRIARPGAASVGMHQTQQIRDIAVLRKITGGDRRLGDETVVTGARVFARSDQNCRNERAVRGRLDVRRIEIDLLHHQLDGDREVKPASYAAAHRPPSAAAFP